jgi:hypothetical protein
MLLEPTQNCVVSKLDSPAALPPSLVLHMNISSLPEAKRRAGRWLGLAIALVLVGGGVCWFIAERTTSAAHTSAVGAAASANPANPTASGVHAPAAAVTTAAAANDPRAAQLTIAGQTRAVVPNVRGEFPRFLVHASATIAASVPFPDAQPGEKIAVQAEDGGALLDAAAMGFVTIDDAHHASLQFKVSAHVGIHRVTLRRGSETHVLEFWVGTEPTVIVRN